MAYKLPGRPDRSISASQALTDKGVKLVTSAFDGAADDSEKAMDDAIDCFRRSLELVPDNPEVHYRLGYSSYLLMDRVDDTARRLALSEQATEQFLKLLNIDPNDEHILDLIGDTLFRQATLSEGVKERQLFFDDAIKHLEHLISLDPEDSEVRGKAIVTLALSFAHRGACSDQQDKLVRFQNAVRWFEDGLELGAVDFAMGYNYATALMDVGVNSTDAKTTRDCYERSLKVLADASARLDRVDQNATGDEADEEALHAIATGTGASYRYNYACLLARMEKEKEAIDALRKLLAMDGARVEDVIADSDFDSIRNLAAFKKLVGG